MQQYTLRTVSSPSYCFSRKQTVTVCVQCLWEAKTSRFWRERINKLLYSLKVGREAYDISYAYRSLQVQLGFFCSCKYKTDFAGDRLGLQLRRRRRLWLQLRLCTVRDANTMLTAVSCKYKTNVGDVDRHGRPLPLSCNVTWEGAGCT